MFGRHQSDVLIAGAGPVGLLGGLALARRGIKPRILDEDSHEGPLSNALALHPSSLRLIEQMGLLDEVLQLGRVIDSIALYERGEKRHSIRLGPLSSTPGSVVVLPQADLERLLAKELERRGIEISWRHRLSHLEGVGETVSAEVERLERVSLGYGVARTDWEIEKVLHEHAQFLIGADGHRSTVRRELGFSFESVAGADSFAVFEFEADTPSGTEASIILNEQDTDVVWPLPDGHWRLSFEIPHQEEVLDSREKGWLSASAGDGDEDALGAEELAAFIRERAPWFKPRLASMSWSAVVRFPRRLTSALGRDRAWLAGDAVHMAAPVGVQSMNAGLIEVADLAGRITNALSGERQSTALAEYGENHLAASKRMLGVVPVDAPLPLSDWAQARLERLRGCLPASGRDLEAMLQQLRP